MQTVASLFQLHRQRRSLLDFDAHEPAKGRRRNPAGGKYWGLCLDSVPRLACVNFSLWMRQSSSLASFSRMLRLNLLKQACSKLVLSWHPRPKMRPFGWRRAPIRRTPPTLDLGIEVRNGIGTGSRTTPSARCVNNNSRNQRNFNLLLAMILNLSCRCGCTR